MPPTSSGKGRGIEFNIDLGKATSKGGKLQADEPLQILIAADCSGRRGRGICAPLSGRRARPISVDNIESVFAAWSARIQTSLRLASGEALCITPRGLEDLHPDHLLRAAEPLVEMLELKAGLGKNPLAAERLTALLGNASSPSASGGGAPLGSASSSAASVAGAGAAEETADTLSRLLGAPLGVAPERRTSDATGARDDVARFIRGVVGSSSNPTPDGTTSALSSAVDLELSRVLRALLRDSHFRELEATWRGIDGLCRNCPDDELVRYQVVDASLAELSADAAGLSSLLEAQRPSVLVVDHSFAATAEELAALAQLASRCADRGVILVTGARPELAGYQSFAVSNPEPNAPPLSDAARAAWVDVGAARSGGAQLALVLPRCLLRQPYGKLGEPLDVLAFEELADPEDHEAFTWGNGAYLAARALAERHAGSGGNVHLDGSVELREMPVVRLQDEGGFRLQPSAEAWLPERTLERLRAAGFAVLQGVRDSDRVRVHL